MKTAYLIGPILCTILVVIILWDNIRFYKHTFYKMFNAYEDYTIW